MYISRNIEYYSQPITQAIKNIYSKIITHIFLKSKNFYCFINFVIYNIKKYLFPVENRYIRSIYELYNHSKHLILEYESHFFELFEIYI